MFDYVDKRMVSTFHLYVFFIFMEWKFKFLFVTYRYFLQNQVLLAVPLNSLLLLESELTTTLFINVVTTSLLPCFLKKLN